jgi:high-affinity iron transporter
MIAGYLLALREGLEAALVIGVALGSVRRMGRPDLRGWIWAGSTVAAALSLMLGLSLNLLKAEFEGPGQEAFEGITTLLAAGLLSWMIFWMQSQRSSPRSGLEANVQRSVDRSQGWGLFLLAFVSVLR